MERRTLVYHSEQEKFVFLLYLALIVWLPIPLGSNRDWAWSLFEIICSLLTIWTLILVIGQRTTVGGIVPYMKWVLLLFLVAIALQIFQIYPIGPELIAQLSPGHFELLSTLEPEQITLSIDKHASMQSLLKQVSYFGLFFLSLVFLADRRRIRVVLLVIATAGVLQCVLAISQWISLSSVGAGLENHLAVSGTFANKNHFAAYLNMIVACIIGLLLFNVYLGNSTGAGSPNNIFSIRSILLVFLTIVVFTIVITRSRGAGISFVFTMLGLISMFSVKRIWRRKFGNNLLIFTIFSVGITMSLGHKIIVDRFSSIKQDIAYRTEIWSLTEKLIRDYPLFGIGAGNYSTLVPAYEQQNFDGFINHAHNDYLEMLAEQGIVGFSIFGLMLLACFLYTLKIIFRSNEVTVLITTGVGLFGVVSMLAHAMLDFNFYIPSNAAYFYVFLALMVSSAHHVKRQHQLSVMVLPNGLDATSANSLRARMRNKMGTLVSIVVLMLTMLFFSTSASGNAGEAMFVLGNVEKTTRSGDTVKLSKGMKIDEGDNIVTFDKGQAMLKMIDNSKISIRPGSSFKINAYSFKNNVKTDKSHYEILKGGFRSLTGIMGKREKSSFHTKSPVATLGVRGTDFAAHSCENDCGDQSGLYVNVIDGRVAATNKAGTIEIKPGQSAHVESANSNPELVEKLPDVMMKGRTGDQSDAPSQEKEMVVIALRGAANSEELAQVVRELVENEMPTSIIIDGATGVGVEPATIGELLLEYSPDKEKVLKELLKAFPQLAGDILSIAASNNYISAERITDIATNAGVSPEIIRSSVALGKLLAPPEDEKNSNSSQSNKPGSNVGKPKPGVPSQLLPGKGSGGEEPISAS